MRDLGHVSKLQTELLNGRNIQGLSLAFDFKSLKRTCCSVVLFDSDGNVHVSSLFCSDIKNEVTDGDIHNVRIAADATQADHILDQHRSQHVRALSETRRRM